MSREIDTVVTFTEEQATAEPTERNGVNFYPVTLTVTANVDGVEQSASRLLYLHRCESTDEHEAMNQATYNSLSDEEKNKDKIYFITDN